MFKQPFSNSLLHEYYYNYHHTKFYWNWKYEEKKEDGWGVVMTFCLLKINLYNEKGYIIIHMVIWLYIITSCGKWMKEYKKIYGGNGIGKWLYDEGK